MRFSWKEKEKKIVFLKLSSQPDLVHFSFERFLENAIREVYPFSGTPISILWKKKEGNEKLVKRKH
jgi:GTP-binding protein